MREDDFIKEIIDIIKLPAEDYSDGECLDLIIRKIQDNGYNIDWNRNEF